MAFVGSRTYPDLAQVRRAVRTLPPGTTLVSGHARGVDRVAEKEADRLGLKVVSLPAEWDELGRSAGMKRNSDIVACSDAVVAFWHRHSSGTYDTIKKAQAKGIPVIIFRST